MAIKERKQITGTAAQIKGFAGHNGVLAYATDTKHLHVLSGTAGTTTELANVSDIPAPVDISGKADKTYVDTELAKKANSSHTHTIANVTGLQEALNSASTQASNAIPKSGNRGVLSGREESVRGQTVSESSPDSQIQNYVNVDVQIGSLNETWTKVMYMTRGTIETGNAPEWRWVGGNAPTLKFPGVLICHWNSTSGILNYITGVA